MQVTNKLLDEMSENLRQAVILTLSLGKKERVFVGNEERMFLYALLQRFPDSNHKTSLKIFDYSEITNHNFHDIWKRDIQRTLKIKRNRPLQDRFRSFAIAIRGIIWSAIRVITLKYKLRNTSTLIHYTSHLRHSHFVTPALTDLYFKHQDTKDKALRKNFSQNLALVKFSPLLVDYLTALFPTSHLESYIKLSTHPITKLEIGTVAASLYGLMSDPLLSFLIKNNCSRLVYVQHGGGYGLNKDHLGHQMEESGSDMMLYWGTGSNNVFPTRYREKYFPKIKRTSMIVLSSLQDEKTIKPYIELAKTISKKWQCNCVVSIHPDSLIYEDKYIRHGTSDRSLEQAQLVIFDNMYHSLMYQRILARRPFLVLDSDFNDLTVQYDDGRRLLLLMRNAELLIPKNKLERVADDWMRFSPYESQQEFRERANLVLNHILNRPKLDVLLEI